MLGESCKGAARACAGGPGVHSPRPLTFPPFASLTARGAKSVPSRKPAAGPAPTRRWLTAASMLESDEPELFDEAMEHAFPEVAEESVPEPAVTHEEMEAYHDQQEALLEDVVQQAMAAGVKGAGALDELLAALERRIARNATPHPVPHGTMVLVPTDERRKSGSHYTPRSSTEPIVRTTLEPVIRQLGENPSPDQILGLKVCDPAMGSGASLVEACRQIADELVKAWAFHGYKPFIPSDEDEVLHARRLVAQRCLYGVDENHMAVDLAKLSLWLATLARDHPFTFLDHALRCGDCPVRHPRCRAVHGRAGEAPQCARCPGETRATGDPLPNLDSGTAPRGCSPEPEPGSDGERHAERGGDGGDPPHTER